MWLVCFRNRTYTQIRCQAYPRYWSRCRALPLGSSSGFRLRLVDNCLQPHCLLDMELQRLVFRYGRP